MRIDAVELRRITLPLVRPFRSAHGTQHHRDVLLVRVFAEGVEGWGECVAGTVPDYSPEYTDGAHQVMRSHIVPLVVGRDIRAEQIAAALDGIVGHRMAKAALEAAVLDAQLRSEERSLADHLGGVHDRVEVGVAVGLSDSLEAMVSLVGRHLEEGYRRIKLKIAPGADIEPVARLRAEFGGDLALQVDANSAYTLDDLDVFRSLDDQGLLLIEQPFAAYELLDHAALAQSVTTPICLDETIVTRRVAQQAVELGACSIIAIKAGRVGGHLEARDIHDDCVEAGVAVWCGGMLETGIGRAANLALASLPGFTLPGDISASDRYWQQDLCDPFVLGENSTIEVPKSPGIGIEVDLDFVESITTQVELIEAD